MGVVLVLVLRPLDKEDLLEGFPELAVEDGVDERVQHGVHVPEPRGDHERVHGGTHVLQMEFDGDRSNDVARKKWDPTKQKAT